jgi:hypothetical protein
MWGLSYAVAAAVVTLGIATTVSTALVVAAVIVVFMCFAWATK